MKNSLFSSKSVSKRTVKLSLIGVFFTSVILLLVSCGKDIIPTPVSTLPVVSTTDVTNTTQTSVTTGGNVSSDGNALVTLRGVCFGLTSNPTISDSKTTDGVGIGNFVSTINGLTPGTTYNARAYATNSVGTGYGNNVSFTTTAIMYPMTIISGLNGTATAPKDVASGGQFIVTAVPSIGYMTDYIDVNGVKFYLNGTNSYTVMNNLKPPIVSVTFKMDILWTLLEKSWIEVLLQKRLHIGGTTWNNYTTGYKVEKYDFLPSGTVRIYYDGQEGYPQVYKVYGDSLSIGTGSNKYKIIAITRDSLIIRTISRYYHPNNQGIIVNDPSLDQDYQMTFKH